MSNFQIHELNSVAVNRNSNIIHDTEVSTDEWDTGKDTAGAVADLASANVAAPYDATVTYAIGQYCLYEGNIYRCIAITTGAFDSTAWVQIVVSGEFRRVVELTSAQYAALTPAEQNNGTIYVKTDEETTADDIPYAAGVSVADVLDSLSTVDIYTLTSTCIVYRVGKLCTLACTGSSIPANTGSYATRHILGTLPEGYRPPTTVFGTPTNFPTLNSFMATNAGEVSVRNADTSNASDCYATLTYIATD